MSNGYDRVSGQGGRGKVKYAVAGIAGIFLVACIIGVAVHSSGDGDDKSNQGSSSSGGQVQFRYVHPLLNWMESAINCSYSSKHQLT